MGKTNVDGTTYTDPISEVTTSVNSAGEVTGVTEVGDPTSSLLVTNPVTELADDAATGDEPTVVDDDAPVDVDGDGVIDKYEALTKAELVELCTNYKPNPLSTFGNKADLVRRLQQADKAAAEPAGTGA